MWLWVKHLFVRWIGVSIALHWSGKIGCVVYVLALFFLTSVVMVLLFTSAPPPSSFPPTLPTTTHTPVLHPPAMERLS